MKEWIIDGQRFGFIGDAENAILQAVNAPRLEQYVNVKKLETDIRGILVDMDEGDSRIFLGVMIKAPKQHKAIKQDGKKIQKTAVQKNFSVDKNFYTETDLIEMENAKIIVSEKQAPFNNSDSDGYKIFADDCAEVKVILNEYGYYQTVVVTHDEQTVYISL